MFQLKRFVCLTLLLFCASTVSAQKSTISDDLDSEVAKWIRALDSTKVADRIEATRELRRMGRDAVKPLERAVLTGDSDASKRALEILGKNLKSAVIGLPQESREALLRIASQSGHPQAEAARQLVSPPEVDSQSRNMRPRQIPLPMIPKQPRNNLQNAPRQNVQTRVRIKSVNGQRDIEATLNGKTYRFVDTPGGGLDVETPDGKGGVNKTQYPSEEAFKQADPAAHKIFSRYGNQNGIKLNFNGGLQFNGGIQPFQQPLIPRFPHMPQFQQPFPAVPEIQQPLERLRPAPQPKLIPVEPKPKSEIIEV